MAVAAGRVWTAKLGRAIGWLGLSTAFFVWLDAKPVKRLILGFLSTVFALKDRFELIMPLFGRISALTLGKALISGVRTAVRIKVRDCWAR